MGLVYLLCERPCTQKFHLKHDTEDNLDCNYISGPPDEDIVDIKMSSENEKTEPKTDLEPGTTYPNQGSWKNLNNDSGAGANAASRLDMTFVASNTLSELVWSPDKGLSLKCADSSFAEKNSSLFWDVGPSNMVLASPQHITDGSSASEKPVAAVCMKTDIDGTDTPIRNPTSDSGAKQECKTYEEHETGKGKWVTSSKP